MPTGTRFPYFRWKPCFTLKYLANRRMGKRSYKLATNLQEQQATGKPQELTENEELRWVDYDALTIKDAYCKENILGETQVTPGKALFSLRHSSKKKSAAWRTEDSEDESENMSDQENALPCSPLANKKRSSNAQKESSKAKEPRSCPPSKRVKEMSVSSCPASAGKAKSTVSSTSSGRPSRAATGRAVNSPMPLRKQVLSARVTPLKAVDTNEELPERTTRSGRVIGTPGSEAKSDTLPVCLYSTAI